MDLAFLDGCAAPTIAVLFEDTKDARHVKTYEVALREKVRGGAGAGGRVGKWADGWMGKGVPGRAC